MCAACLLQWEGGGDCPAAAGLTQRMEEVRSFRELQAGLHCMCPRDQVQACPLCCPSVRHQPRRDPKSCCHRWGLGRLDRSGPSVQAGDTAADRNRGGGPLRPVAHRHAGGFTHVPRQGSTTYTCTHTQAYMYLGHGPTTTHSMYMHTLWTQNCPETQRRGRWKMGYGLPWGTPPVACATPPGQTQLTGM